MFRVQACVSISRLWHVCALFGLPLYAFTAVAADLTNEDIVNLTKAGLDDQVIIQAIIKGPTAFVLTAPEIIRLKQSGVSNQIISRMMSPDAGSTTKGGGQQVPTKDSMCGLAASGAITIRSKNGDFTLGYKKGRKETESSGGGRAIASILTFGIVSLRKETHYAILSGSKAEMISKGTPIEFVGLAIDRGQSPDDAIKLVNLSSDSASRSLPIGEGTLSYWGSASGTLSHAPLEGYASPLKFEKIQDDCSINGRSMSIWSAKTVNSMKGGEYAIFLQPDRYHDFAVLEEPQFEKTRVHFASGIASSPKVTETMPSMSVVGVKFSLRTYDVVTGNTVEKSELRVEEVTAEATRLNEGAVVLNNFGVVKSGTMPAPNITGLGGGRLVAGFSGKAAFMPLNGGQEVELSVTAIALDSLVTRRGVIPVVRCSVSGRAPIDNSSMTGISTGQAEMSGEILVEPKTGIIVAATIKSRNSGYTMGRETIAD